jgi:Zn finger protein HypA/HybF involved in hydrogenase expression
MNDYLHQDIDLENTKIVWDCEDCGKVFEDENKYVNCQFCGSSNCTHEHVAK